MEYDLSQPENTVKYLLFLRDYANDITQKTSIYPKDLHYINTELDRFIKKYKKTNPKDRAFVKKLQALKFPKYQTKEPLFSTLAKMVLSALLTNRRDKDNCSAAKWAQRDDKKFKQRVFDFIEKLDQLMENCFP